MLAARCLDDRQDQLRTPKWPTCLVSRVIAGEAGRTLLRAHVGHASGDAIRLSLNLFSPISDAEHLCGCSHASLCACARVVAKSKRRTSVGLSDQGTVT